MKKLKYILGLIASAMLFNACSEEDIVKRNPMDVQEGLPVQLQLSVDNLPKVTVDTRATNDERALQIFIFNEEGKLTGYAKRGDEITEENPTNTDGEPDPITIKTLTGKAYIYAIVNHKTNTYETTELDSYFTQLDEIAKDPTIAGSDMFTHDDFLKFKFGIASENIDLIYYSNMQALMSGMYREEKTGENTSCFISMGTNGKGAVYKADGTMDEKPTIYLKYIGSKITFDLSGFAGNFTVNNARVYNIAKEGRLIEGTTDKPGTKLTLTEEQITNANVKLSGTEFTIFLPENLQDKKGNTTLDKWQLRETQTAESVNLVKAFKYAPDYGTYVVLEGEYDNEVAKHMGTVQYTIHLGDFDYETKVKPSNDYNDFNVNRHYEYTYTLSANDVLDIRVVAKVDKEDEKGVDEETYPGTEGVIIDYSKDGYSYTVDSHYEAVLFKLKRQDKTAEGYKPYTVLVKEFGRMTPPIDTTDPNWEKDYLSLYKHNDEAVKDYEGKQKYSEYWDDFGDDDIEWITFAPVDKIKEYARSANSINDTESTYKNDINTQTLDRFQPLELVDKTDHPRGGVIPFLTYTYTKQQNVNNPEDCLMDVRTFIKGLREAENDTETIQKVWGNTKVGEERVFVAFIKENYYSRLSWDKYTNQPMRAFYLAKEGYISKDNRSVWYEVDFAVQQRSIQTFYRTANSGSTIAYGCEYENNESILMELNDYDYQVTLPEMITYKEENQYGNQLHEYHYDAWNGLYNTMLDIWFHEQSFGKGGGTIPWNRYCVNGFKGNKGEEGYTGTAGEGNVQGAVDNVQTSYGMIRNMHLAFVNRNRDNDRDGKVDAEEIRWYTPTTEQYCGLWIGEQSYDKEARLCHYDVWTESMIVLGDGALPFKPEYIRHYYTSTPGMRTYWAEEGFAFGSFGLDEARKQIRPYYLRCARNLASNQLGVNFGDQGGWYEGMDGEHDNKNKKVHPHNETPKRDENWTTEQKWQYEGSVPNRYYSYDPQYRIISLDNVEPNNKDRFSPLNQSLREQRVQKHTERSEFNRPYKKFQISYNRTQYTYSWDQILNSKTDVTPFNQGVSNSYNSWYYQRGYRYQEQLNIENYKNNHNVGRWRIPVLNELALMILVARDVNGNVHDDYYNNSDNDEYPKAGNVVTPGDHGDAAVTSFQIPSYRQGGYYARIQREMDGQAPSVMMSMSNTGMNDYYPVRPVRDVE